MSLVVVPGGVSYAAQLRAMKSFALPRLVQLALAKTRAVLLDSFRVQKWEK